MFENECYKASSGAATTAASVASAPTRSQDPAWAHGQVIIGNRNSTLCLHCNKRINGGGITRFKVSPCWSPR